MKMLLISLCVALMTQGCNAQQKNREKTDQPMMATGQSKPQVDWKVNKKYDENGNLIAYDSTYTWSYSSEDGRPRSIAADSVMAAFRQHFDAEFPSFFKQGFGNPVWNDSLLYKDFSGKDYFMKKWRNQYFDMGKMMLQMDSMRNSFLQRNYPNLSTKEI